jgi:DinB superfamily
MEELYTRTVVDSWSLVIGRIDQAVAKLSDEKLQDQIAPGKNRVLYLIGHLTVANDRMFPLLGLGERLHPELDEAYFNHPDRAIPDPLSTPDLRKAWSEVNSKLSAAFKELTPKQWLEKHNSVSEEDFAVNPLRNRLAVLMSRTNHASYHAGQAILAS